MARDKVAERGWQNRDAIKGVIYLIFSSIFAGLGNSLEPVSILVWLHLYFLIAGFHILTTFNSTQKRWWEILIICSLLICLEACGFCIGYSGIFGYPSTTVATVAYSYGFGLLAWIAFCIFAIVPHIEFHKKYPDNSWLCVVFPICYTMTTHTLIGLILSTFPAIANAVLDYEPLRQMASLTGLSGITFTVCFISTSIALHHVGQSKAISVFKLAVYGFFVTMIITGFMIYANCFYQKPVDDQITSSLNVSCVFAQSAEVGSTSAAHLWGNTQARLDAGDTFILWAEEALLIQSDEEEAAALTQAQNMAKTAATSYIGITYQKLFPEQTMGTNQFALITPLGDIAWNYHKAHPVPLIESNVIPGPPVVPTFDSPYGRLAGGICFDLDYPQYIAQAGRKKVDIFLQPSWTWNALSSRHFNGDAMRAVENGFTLLRCSSEGESGVVDPRGSVKARRFTGSDPSVVVTFSLPLEKRVETLFSQAGFLFEWFILAATVFIYLVILLPKSWLNPLFLWVHTYWEAVCRKAEPVVYFVRWWIIVSPPDSYGSGLFASKSEYMDALVVEDGRGWNPSEEHRIVETASAPGEDLAKARAIAGGEYGAIGEARKLISGSDAEAGSLEGSEHSEELKQ